jgi:hypothetical protein
MNEMKTLYVDNIQRVLRAACTWSHARYSDSGIADADRVFYLVR